jgi:hypothetical protein
LGRTKSYLKTELGIWNELFSLPYKIDEVLTSEYLKPEARQYLEQAKDTLIKARDSQRRVDNH